jgi:hypothetical protein
MIRYYSERQRQGLRGLRKLDAAGAVIVMTEVQILSRRGQRPP